MSENKRKDGSKKLGTKIKNLFHNQTNVDRFRNYFQSHQFKSEYL